MKCNKSILTKLGQEIPVLEKQEGQLRGGFLLLKTDEDIRSTEETTNINNNYTWLCSCNCINQKSCLVSTSSTDTTLSDTTLQGNSAGFIPSMII